MASEIEELVMQVKATNSTEGHKTYSNIIEERGMTIVMSAFNNRKPAHMVLNELNVWAEKNNMKKLLTKLEELEKDMSWYYEK